MTKTEITTLYFCDDDNKKTSNYIVKLSDKKEDKYRVSISPNYTSLMHCITGDYVKDKKIIKLVTDELMNYLSNSIAPIKDIITTIENEITRTKTSMRWMKESKEW